MKLGLFLSTLAVATGALALVYTAGPAPRDPGPPLRLQAAAAKGADLEVQHAPVPLLMKARAAFEAPTGELSASHAEPAARSGTESTARAVIEADGYKSVRILNKGLDDMWHATALRGTTAVLVTVDAQGNVSAD